MILNLVPEVEIPKITSPDLKNMFFSGSRKYFPIDLNSQIYKQTISKVSSWKQKGWSHVILTCGCSMRC